MVIVLEDTKSNAVTGGSTTQVDISSVVITGSNKYLLVAVGFNNDDLQTVSSVTIDPGGGDETALSVISGSRSTFGPDDGYTELWAVTNPPSGTFTVRAIISAQLRVTGHTLGAGSWSFSGVDQDTPVGTAATAGADAANLQVTITSATNEFAVATGFIEGAPTFTAINGTSGVVEDWDDTPADDSTAGGHVAGASPNVVIGWNHSADKTVRSGISVKPSKNSGPF